MANSWVDYANLGLNAANAAMNVEQLRSLSAANAQLAELSQIEADRERRRQIENKLRQFVFDQEIKLKDLVEAAGATTAAKWFGATLIKQELDGIPVAASSFQEFVDKDRVATFQRRLIQTIQENQRQLTASQSSELQMALRILNERQALSEYIAAVQAQEYLDQTQAEWEKREKIEKTSENQRVLLGCAVPVLLVIGGFPVAAVIAGMFNEDIANSFWGISFAIAVLLPLVAFLMSFRGVKTRELKELGNRRDAATNKVPSERRMQELRQLFGMNATPAWLLQEQQRREQSFAAIVRRI
jgi:hypothetical protein